MPKLAIMFEIAKCMIAKQFLQPESALVDVGLEALARLEVRHFLLRDQDGGLCGDVARRLGSTVLEAECAETSEVDRFSGRYGFLDGIHQTLDDGCNFFSVDARGARNLFNNLFLCHDIWF